MFGKWNHPSTIAPYSPQSNRIVERKKTKFKGNDECLTYKLLFTKKFMGKTILTVHQIINKVPHNKTRVIPY